MQYSTGEGIHRRLHCNLPILETSSNQYKCPPLDQKYFFHADRSAYKMGKVTLRDSFINVILCSQKEYHNSVSKPLPSQTEFNNNTQRQSTLIRSVYSLATSSTGTS